MVTPDPTTTTTTDTTDTSTSDLQSLMGVQGSVVDLFGKIRDAANEAGYKLGQVGNISQDTAAKFGALSTFIAGATNSFNQFANVDTTRLDTYGNQFKSLLDTVTKSGTVFAAGGTMLSEPVKLLTSTLMGMGVPADKVKSTLTDFTGKTLVQFAANVIQNIDNVRKLDNAFMQTSASAGDLGAMYKMVHDDLSGLNDVNQDYIKGITQAALASHTTTDVMSSYAMQLTNVHGGLETVVKQLPVAGTNMTILTAAVNYAIGSNRKYEDVIKDINDAVTNYGVKIDDALKFTARISEISEKYGARMEDVSSQLKKSTDDFKMFTMGGENAANMLDNISQTMGGFIDQMGKIGVPARNAMELFNTIASRIQGMSEAQAAFLSSTTGGFQDLRGVFQIDEMLGKGDFQQVYQKVVSQIKQMTGTIVSREEAAASPQAAEQYMRQIQILRQGPLGQMARTRQEAETLLAALQKPGGMEMQQEALKDPTENLVTQAERGNKIGETQTTIMSKMERELEAIRLMGGAGMLPVFQNVLAQRSITGGTGAGGIDQIGKGINTAFRENMGLMTRAAGAPSPGGGQATMFNNLGQFTADLPSDIQGAINAGSDTFSSVQKDIMTNYRASMDESMRQSKLTPQGAAYTPPGQQIGETVRSIPSIGLPGNSGASTPPSGLLPIQNTGPIPVVLTGDNKFTITINCPNCGTKYEQTAYGKINNPAGR